MTQPSTVSEDIFQRLKRSTAEIHEQVEQELQIFSPEFDLPAYKVLLARFYGFWGPLERELCKVSELQHSDLALSTRLKAHLLEADLRMLGTDPFLVPVCSALPNIGTFPEGLGCLYVLEGSTLGAKFIAKHIAERFDIHHGSGASFFNAYGQTLGERWSDFKRFVTSQLKSEQGAEVLSAAKNTFDALYRWLAMADDKITHGGP